MPKNAALITALILERPLCISCVATKATISESRVEASLAEIAPALRIRREFYGRCRACGEIGVVVSVVRPDAA